MSFEKFLIKEKVKEILTGFDSEKIGINGTFWVVLYDSKGEKHEVCSSVYVTDLEKQLKHYKKEYREEQRKNYLNRYKERRCLLKVLKKFVEENIWSNFSLKHINYGMKWELVAK